MPLHESITPDRVVDMVEQCNSSLDTLGICTSCGEEAYGVEPDAQNYTCDCCEEETVFGCEILLFMI